MRSIEIGSLRGSRSLSIHRSIKSFISFFILSFLYVYYHSFPFIYIYIYTLLLFFLLNLFSPFLFSYIFVTEFWTITQSDRECRQTNRNWSIVSREKIQNGVERTKNIQSKNNLCETNVQTRRKKEQKKCEETAVFIFESTLDVATVQHED